MVSTSLVVSPAVKGRIQDEESRYYLILAKDLDYGEVQDSSKSKTLEDVSRLLALYDRAIRQSIQ